MSYLSVQISFQKIQEAIKRLAPAQRVKLVESLEKSTWPDRLKSLLRKIDQKAAEFPISEKDIDQACNDVRHKRHVHRRFGH